MDRYGRAVEEGSLSDPSPEWTAPGNQTGFEGSMWRFGLGESYPARPNEPDCIYYLRTGVCRYGSRCRFNHPRDRGAVTGAARAGVGEFPERVGQPLCQYYMRTGTCKFGTSCKYHHPRQGNASLNYLGYPLRLGGKECSYYMKTGQCKFGATCKFHHPVPPRVQAPAPPPAAQVSPLAAAPAVYPTFQPQSVPSSQEYGVVMARPPLMPGSYVQSPYGPMLLSPNMDSYLGLSPYPTSASAVPSPGAQPSPGSSSVHGVAPLSPFAPAYAGTYLSGLFFVGPSSSGQREQFLPQRPDQPECQHYMKTGDCKFGYSCRYHHPPEVAAPKTSVILGPISFPLRPGAPPCSHYAQHWICKFGSACKFDHPMGTLGYSPSASFLTDMPIAPYPVGFSVGNLAPSSSSSDLRQELVSEKASSSVSITSGSAGQIMSSASGSISGSDVVPESGQSSSTEARASSQVDD